MKSNDMNFRKNHKLHSYQIQGGKTVKNVQIDPQATEIWAKELIVMLSVSDNLVREAQLLITVHSVLLQFFPEYLFLFPVSK